MRPVILLLLALLCVAGCGPQQTLPSLTGPPPQNDTPFNGTRSSTFDAGWETLTVKSDFTYVQKITSRSGHSIVNKGNWTFGQPIADESDPGPWLILKGEIPPTDWCESPTSNIAKTDILISASGFDIQTAKEASATVAAILGKAKAGKKTAKQSGAQSKAAKTAAASATPSAASKPVSLAPTSTLQPASSATSPSTPAQPSQQPYANTATPYYGQQSGTGTSSSNGSPGSGAASEFPMIQRLKGLTSSPGGMTLDILCFGLWIFTIVDSARKRKWGWLAAIAILCCCPLVSIAYLLFGMKRQEAFQPGNAPYTPPPYTPSDYQSVNPPSLPGEGANAPGNIPRAPGAPPPSQSPPPYNPGDYQSGGPSTLPPYNPGDYQSGAPSQPSYGQSPSPYAPPPQQQDGPIFGLPYKPPPKPDPSQPPQTDD